MSRRSDFRGGSWFGIGIERPKIEANLGTLFRSAVAFRAGMVFTVGNRYHRQATDTINSWRHVPYIPYADLDAFTASRPVDAALIGVEITDQAKPLGRFWHPRRALYLLGPEDGGLSKAALALCQDVVVIPTDRCLNVSAAGTVVMYDRVAKADS